MTRGLSSFWDELVTAGDDLDRVLELVAHRAAEVVGEAGVLTMLSDDGTVLEPRAVHHSDADVRSFIRSVLAAEPYKVGEGIAGAVAARREPAVLSGLDVDDLAGVVAPHALRFLERYPLRSVAVVPMVAFGDLVGTLGVVRTASTVPYDDEDVMVLEALAERAAVALAEVRRGPRRLGAPEYEAIFRHSLDGVMFTVPDGRILAANPAACEILGISEAEICRLGRAGVLVHDERTRAAVAQRAATGATRGLVPMRRGDGEVFTAELTSSIFTTAEGELRATVIFRDVTEQVRAQEQLTHQHELLTLLHRATMAINTAPDVTGAIQATLDAVGDATGWPLGDALLLSDDGVLRPSAAWRVADPDRHAGFREWMQPFTLDPDRGVAGRVVTTSSPVWIGDLASMTEFVRGHQNPPTPLRSYVGVPIMVGSSARGVLELFSEERRPRDDGLLDVLADLGTQLGRAIEREEAEAAHRRLDEDRAEFVARAAHELRNPVAALVLAVGMLAEQEPADPHDRELLDVVVDSADHLNRLVARLLDLSRIGHATEVRIEPIDLAQVVERSLLDCPAPDICEVAWHVPPGTRALADELSLVQIVVNLLGNAFRYGGPHVKVEARRTGDHVEVSVADDGPGVEPAIERRMFDPFVRAARGGGEGAGLGLAISGRLAEAMGGRLRYERPDGGGSRFVVELPAAA